MPGVKSSANLTVLAKKIAAAPTLEVILSVSRTPCCSVVNTSMILSTSGRWPTIPKTRSRQFLPVSDPIDRRRPDQSAHPRLVPANASRAVWFRQFFLENHKKDRINTRYGSFSAGRASYFACWRAGRKSDMAQVDAAASARPGKVQLNLRCPSCGKAGTAGLFLDRRGAPVHLETPTGFSARIHANDSVTIHCVRCKATCFSLP